jgi:hypothetical protein
MFGEPISLKENRSSSHTTLLGGIMTICLLAAISSYFFVGVSKIVNNTFDSTFKTVHVGLLNDDTPYNITLNDFDIGIRLWYRGSNKTVAANL